MSKLTDIFSDQKIRPSGGRRQPRSPALKSDACDKIIRYLSGDVEPKRVSVDRREIERLNDEIAFEGLPKREQVVKLYGRLGKLRRELDGLEYYGDDASEIKRMKNRKALYEPVINIQIMETQDKLESVIGEGYE